MIRIVYFIGRLEVCLELLITIDTLIAFFKGSESILVRRRFKVQSWTCWKPGVWIARVARGVRVPRQRIFWIIVFSVSVLLLFWFVFWKRKFEELIFVRARSAGRTRPINKPLSELLVWRRVRSSRRWRLIYWIAEWYSKKKLKRKG